MFQDLKSMSPKDWLTLILFAAMFIGIPWVVSALNYALAPVTTHPSVTPLDLRSTK